MGTFLLWTSRTARSPDHVQSFCAAHRDGNDFAGHNDGHADGADVADEDIEGVLWWFLRDEGVTFEDIAADGAAVWFLLESMLGRGTSAVESERLDLADLRPGDHEL